MKDTAASSFNAGVYAQVPLPLLVKLPAPVLITKPVAVSAEPSTSLAFASNSACVIIWLPLSSAIAVSVTGVDAGASLTAVISKLALPVVNKPPSVIL